MILRYLTDFDSIVLAQTAALVQDSKDNAQKSLRSLAKAGLIELSGKIYMLSAKSCEALKVTVDNPQNKSTMYRKVKTMIKNGCVTNEKIRELCGLSKQQARNILDKMKKERLIVLIGRGPASKYKKLI